MRAIYLLVCGFGTVFMSACGNSTVVEEEPAATDTVSVEVLVEQLSSGDEAARCLTIDALAEHGADAAPAVQALIGLMADESALVRAHAARTLGEIGDPAKPAAEVLAQAMADDNEDVRLMAVGALAKIKPGKEKVVPLMLKAMADEDYSVVLRATHALSSLGPDVVEPMIEALKNKKTAHWAVLVLHDLGPDAKPAVPALLAILEDGDPETQAAVVEALGDIGDPAAIPKLVEIANDHPYDIEIVAAFALSKFGPAAKDAAPHLEKGLESDDPAMQTVCAYSLAMIFPDDEEKKKQAVELLVKAMTSDEEKVRVAAASALLQLNPDPEIVKGPFLAAIATSDEATRQGMFASIASLGEEVVPRLQRALKEKPVRPYAARALGEIGPKAADAVPDLVASLEGESPEVREQILMAIGHIGENLDQAMPAAKAALADEDPHVKRGGIYVLGRIGPGAKAASDDLYALLQSTGDNDDEDRLGTFAAWALVSIDPSKPEYAKAAVPHLKTALEDARVGVRVEAAEALGKLGALAKDAVGALEEAGKKVSDEEKAVYDEAISKIKG